ncbi:ATP-binding protein, partial [Streptomyces sp. SID9124]|nr:ATP-binding protein [Streptomyces sp. SID9124]
DPGLVAAFRRGIDLADARAESEQEPAPRAPSGATSTTTAAQPAAPSRPLPVRGAPAPAQLHGAGAYSGDHDPLAANPTKE